MAIHGVNLGGWLVLERWITPSVFKGTMAHDEYGLCRELGDKKTQRLTNHRDTFITEDDIRWIAQTGLDAVRLPVPYWVFGGQEPFEACGQYVDWLMDTALKYKLQVLIDLHAAPHSQNGNDHSGQAGRTAWHKEPGAITQTLDTIEKLTERYSRYPNLLGIELINEPSGKIPKNTLLDYFRLGYERIRRFGDDFAVIISDSFNPHDWQDELTATEYKNTWLDTHLYQCFSRDDKRLSIHRHLLKAKHEWSELVAGIQVRRPVMIGEWSLSLDPKSFRGMDDFERDKALQAYGSLQMQSFEPAQAWFYWTYKTEDGGSWSMRDCVSRGWLPSTFGYEVQ